MHNSLDLVRGRFSGAPVPCDAWSLRVVRQVDEVTSVRRDVAEPPRVSEDFGVMITVARGGGCGYSATSEVTDSGLCDAFARAAAWADRAAEHGVDRDAVLPQPASGDYRSPVARTWDGESHGDRTARLLNLSRTMHSGDQIVDWAVSLWHTHLESLIVGSAGGEVRQVFDYIVPMASVTASDGRDTQTRSFGGHAYARQGGLEVLDEVGFWDCGRRLHDQALELLAADNCPSGTMPVVLAPDQMILQIHESIGHPLELDRILGDERNYAGGSFVSLAMFGSYRYGSEGLNVSFEPGLAGEFACYGFDDEGQPAERVELIRDGILLRPLGGARSQHRAGGLAGVSNARAGGWNRPAIDRMANLNLAPGDSSFESLLAGIEDGVYMATNRSWSIDDSRNKFQFGCEYGRRIRDGRLAEVVKNPSYRGLSATFWRNLERVGDADTVEVLGTPFCGKGEPNQIVRVGHASPACRFRDVEVFGGE